MGLPRVHESHAGGVTDQNVQLDTISDHLLSVKSPPMVKIGEISAQKSSPINSKGIEMKIIYL